MTVVANAEKKVPREWINEAGDNVNEKFIEYALPLIQGETQLTYANGLPDGVVDVTDLTVLARSLAHWPGYDEQINEANADIDGKDGVTAVDYTILARALARWPGYAEDYGIVLP